ncbi:MFS transporter [Actinosynnema sp. NPDC023794]
MVSAGTGFWRLWTSSGLSNLADGTFKVVLPLVAVQTTREPTLVAGLVFALPAGALTDRLDRRRTVIRANTARAVLPAVLAAAVASGWASTWFLYAIAFAAGIAETLYDTSARSLLPQLVDRDRLPRANARLLAVELTALWLVALAVLWSVRGTFKVHREHRTTLRADIGEGCASCCATACCVPSPSWSGSSTSPTPRRARSSSSTPSGPVRRWA